MKTNEIYLQAKDVELSLANTPQVTFEVTDACNLNCTYCGYGTFYSDYDTRENKRLPTSQAIALLYYLSKLWNSSLNKSANQNVYISFYGGEPLLNMPFIQTVVDYVENQLRCPNRHFTFSMTSNAILLHKYMDFFLTSSMRHPSQLCPSESCSSGWMARCLSVRNNVFV